MKRETVLLSALALLSFAAHAQDAYPSRPISVIVPFAPGGAADISGRPFAALMEKELGQPLVIVNRGGAAGAIGTQSVTAAKPDGYTLLVTVVQVSILPTVDELFGRAPSYTREQLIPIARLTADPVVFITGASSGLRTLKDLIEATKQKPGGVAYSSGGSYSGSHLPVELLAHAVDARFLQVPYKGGGPSMTAVLGGDVVMTAQVPGVVGPHVKAGKAVALAHSGKGRLKELPEVPSLKELGFDVEFYLWAGFFAPRGTPEPALRRIREATAKVLKSEDFARVLANIRAEPGAMEGPEFARWWEEDSARLIATVRKIGRVEQ